MERPAVLYDCNGLYSCHLDKIVNLLGRLSLGTPVREFVDLVYWGVKSHSRLGWQHPMGWGPRLKSKKRRSRAPSFSLFLDCRCNVTCDLVFLQPYFPHHDKLPASINPSSLNGFTLGILSQQQQQRKRQQLWLAMLPAQWATKPHYHELGDNSITHTFSQGGTWTFICIDDKL